MARWERIGALRAEATRLRLGAFGLEDREYVQVIARAVALDQEAAALAAGLA